MGQQGCIPSGVTRSESASCLLQLLEASCHFLACGFFHLQASDGVTLTSTSIITYPPPDFWHLFIYLFIYLFKFYFSERGEERVGDRERNIDLRETWISCFLYVPSPGTEPATQASALTRNITSDLSVCKMMSNHLSHTGWGQLSS